MCTLCLQVCGALEVIHSLLKGSPAQEQLFAFLFEPGHVEVLFSLLVQKKFSDEVRERVFKVRRGPRCRPLRPGASPRGCRHPSVPRQILYKMLKYEKVPERCKNRLKLKDIGYQGLIACLSDVPGSMLLFRCLSEQVLGAGTVSPSVPSWWHATGPSWWLPSSVGLAGGRSGELWWLLGAKTLSLPADPPNYKDLVAVVYLSHRAELTVRLDICRKVSRARCRGCHHGVTTGLNSPMGSRGHGDSENTPQWDPGVLRTTASQPDRPAPALWGSPSPPRSFLELR